MYFHQSKNIEYVMVTTGNPLSDDKIVSYVMVGLGDDYNNFTASMPVIAGIDDFTLRDLYEHMTTYEVQTGDCAS
jgi:hypothetical protein